jgi:lipoate-protein ligase B
MGDNFIADVEWRVSPRPIDYETAVAEMERRALAIREDGAPELVWLLEHPPLYTAGTSADPAELLTPDRFPVHRTGRGGRYTYHGPGQRIGYVLIDLDKRGRDVRCFVAGIECWMIEALAKLGVDARQESGRIGIWTGHGPDEAKIGAIGVRVRRWVTLHGFAVNVDPDLSHFAGIVPCGISDYGVTSLAALGIPDAGARLDAALRECFPNFLERIGTAQRPVCGAHALEAEFTQAKGV